MQRYYILVLFAIFLNLSAAKADHLRDSIGVENLHGKKLILHQIVAKDTYYSLGRRYNISPKVIMTYNDNKYLSLGVVIKVPTDIPFSGTAPAATTKTAAAINTVLPAAGVQDANVTEHAVEKKENLNMLAQRYGTTVDEIKRINNLKTVNLRIGQVLKIPVKDGTVADTKETVNPVNQVPVNQDPVTAPPVQAQNLYKKADRTKKQEVPVNKPDTPSQTNQDSPAVKDPLIVHTVAGNETMYSIASKYNLTLDQLKAKNNLSANSLYIGQKLLISGQYPAKQEHPAEQHHNDTAPLEGDTAETVKNPSLRLPPSRYGLSQMDEKGMGVSITDPDLDSSKMLVLHRTAPIGTIMKITNPMSNRSTFAKVVGKFTENESTKDVIIVMTK
ncbi:MAG TPA: LysM peptidoglycan-binding domain-containing protein, partial [Pedobacter sp.]